MNFFKKIGSFATGSWKDFSEFYDQQPLDETEAPDDQLPNDSFELKKRHDQEFERKKTVHGFFSKRFSKKKLVMDDPRSPTTEFQRTPIQLIKEYEPSGIVSPFNVKDMLASIDSVINTTPKAEVCYEESEAKVDNIIVDKDFEDTTCDWKDFKFKEKILTDSLIVEVSTLEIRSDISQTSNFENIVEDTNVLEDLKECLLKNDEVAKTSDCKVVGCIVKDGIQGESISAQKKIDQPTLEMKLEPLVASTPKKLSANSKLIDDAKKVPRSPLVSISNSPMVNKNKLANNKNYQITKKQISENSKKKKVNSNSSRQLPKAPSTPLTPLFKNGNKCVSHFDKENF